MALFAERLKILRAEKELSRKALSDMIGINESSINMYERGEREPGLESLEIIADFFNVDMDYLLGRQAEKNKFKISNIEKADCALSFQPTTHEIKVFEAYHSQPETQPFVDKLLGIEKEAPKTEEPLLRAQFVAYGGKGVETRYVSKENADKGSEIIRKMKEKQDKERRAKQFEKD